MNYKQWKDYDKQDKLDLIEKAKSGDNKAVMAIWNSMIGAIYKVVLRYRFNSGSLEVEDLVSEAFIPFRKSIDTFDINGGADLLTYIINNVVRNTNRVVAKKSTIISIPSNIQEKNYKIKKALRKIQEVSVNDGNIDVVSHETGLSKKVINNVIHAYRSIPSTNEKESFLEENVVENDVSEVVIDAFDRLKSELSIAEWSIIRMYFGLGTDQLTKKIIMDKLNISRGTFDKILEKSRKILREND